MDSDIVKKRDHRLIVKQKTSDQTVNNSATMVAATGMSWAVAANTNWAFCIWSLIDSGAVPDIELGWDLPAATTGFWDFSDSGSGSVVTLATDKSISGAGAGTTKANFIYGMMNVGATAGTAQLTFAQKVADASDTKLLEGTTIVAWRL